VAGAVAAQAGGAARIELCAHLEAQGLTPPPELLQAARATCGLPIMAMVRPRAGDFRLRPGDLDAMERDLERVLDQGADGVVLGCLLEDGRIDAAALERLVSRARGKPVTFHRAFDRTPDAVQALDLLAELGVARVLTSGHAATALAGAGELARLVRMAGERLVVLPGGGIRAHNVREVLRRTGCREVHSAVGRAGAEAVGELVRALEL